MTLLCYVGLVNYFLSCLLDWFLFYILQLGLWLSQNFGADLGRRSFFIASFLGVLGDNYLFSEDWWLVLANDRVTGDLLQSFLFFLLRSLGH